MPCNRRCVHGGVCDLDRGHAGMHSASGYCRFSDDEAISDLDGDLLFAGQQPELFQAFGSLFGPSEDEENSI